MAMKGQSSSNLLPAVNYNGISFFGIVGNESDYSGSGCEELKTQLSPSITRSSAASSVQASTPVSHKDPCTRMLESKNSFKELSIERLKAAKQKNPIEGSQYNRSKTMNELIGELYELQNKKVKKTSNKKTAEKKIIEQVIPAL